jgi:hypothetical protein
MNSLDERIDQYQSIGSTLPLGRPQEDIRNRFNPNPVPAERYPYVRSVLCPTSMI